MEAKANDVSCGQILFFIVFGLRFFCLNCQRYPQQMQHLTPPQQVRAMPVTIPIQKDLLSTENRLHFQILRPRSSLGYAEKNRNPLPITYPEQIKDLNRSKRLLINRQQITRRVSDKISEAFPTRYTYSTKPSDKVLQAIMAPKDYERFRDPILKTSFEINRESLRSQDPLVVSKDERTLFELMDTRRQEFEAQATTGYPDNTYHRQQKSFSIVPATAESHQKPEGHSKIYLTRSVRKISPTSSFSTIASTVMVQSSGEDPERTERENPKFLFRIQMSPTISTLSTVRPPFIKGSPNDKRQNFQPSLIQAPSSNFMPILRPSIPAYIDGVPQDSSSSNFNTISRFLTSSTATTESSITDKTDPSMITDSIKTKIQDQSTTDHIYRNNNLQAVFTDTDLAEIDPADDRSDLLDIIEDRRSGNRLINFLEKRNMTLGELVEHRKRGSSQLHLETFVQNRSGVFPDKKVVVNDDMDIVTAFENFPHFNLLNLKSVRPDEIKTDSQGSSYFTSIIDIEPTDKEDSGKGSVPDSNRSMSYWTSLALATSLSSAENEGRFLQEPQDSNDPVGEDPVLQIEHEVARAHDLVDLELSGHGFKSSPMNLIHKTEMSPGIRSAIVASVVIVLTSLLIFMVVFVVCRWIHGRRRRKLDKIEICNAILGSTSVIASCTTEDTLTTATNLQKEKVPSRVGRSNSHQSQHRHHGSGFPSVMSLSATCPKLETMDLSSPVVEDYLFNAMRQ